MNLRCMSYCLVFKEIMTPQGCRRKPSRSFGQRRVAVEDVGVSTKALALLWRV